jgi:predicted PurR-regulated permease PerM
MDFSKALTKIADIVIKINEFYEKVKGIYNKYAIKINGWIDELNELFEKIVNAPKQMIVWLEMKLNKLLKKISDAIKSVTDKINDLKKQVGEWYDTTISSTKKNVIISVFSKIGQSITDNTAEMFASTIPHPSFDSLVPEIKIELTIPEIPSSITDKMQIPLDGINIQKIPLL